MAVPPPFDRIRHLYHFTDSRNLKSIKKNGGLHSTARLREMGMNTFQPGGNEVSLDADRRFGMDRFVHPSFNTNHPLEYLARRDGRIQRTAWLYVKPDVLTRDGVLFTPGVANRAGMEAIPIFRAADMIDFEVLYTRTDWSDPAMYARRQAAEKCEVLIPDMIPFEFFSEYFPNG
ncbi:MAG: DarT ssDNA thymidine ADP-ribosyltransferase family protein [Acidobacteriaceae bacterium]